MHTILRGFAPLADFTMTIPNDWWLSSNIRRNRQEHARITRWLRDLARTEARRQGLPTALPTPLRVESWVSYPTNSKADPANAYPTVKPLLDGLTDHGMWPDDNHHHLTGPDPRYAGVTPHKRTIRFVIYPEYIASELPKPPGRKKRAPQPDPVEALTNTLERLTV